MCFIWKMDLKMFMVKIESYGEILSYFCEIEKYIILVCMTLINEYKLEKYNPCQ